MNKKVSLISIYSKDTVGIPPLGPLYLATALKKHGFEVQIVHKQSQDINSITKEIEDFHPDLIGMSVFTGYQNENCVNLSKYFKSKGYLIVWGNAHPSLLPEQVLKEDYIDFIVFGEGEQTLVDLVKNLDNQEEFKNIDGLGFKDSFGIHVNERTSYINIDDYLIDWSLINVEDYLVPYFSNEYKRVLAITTSRGCPYNCQFCYNLVFNKRKWRAHSAEKLIENIKPLVEKYNIDAIRFLDDNFFVDKERAFAIAKGLNLPYFGDARVEYVNEEFVQRLIDTKCREVMFGFESGSDRILLDVVRKGTKTKDIINAVTLLKNSKIMASGSIVFGFPGETFEEYKETMRFIVKLLEINNNLAFTCGWFLPYPGTGLYEKAKELGFKPPAQIKDWDIFDRWRNDYTMDWIKWDYKLPVRYSRRIIQLLALCYKRNIPILKQLFKFRVWNLNFKFPVDIIIFSKIRRIYMSHSNNIFYVMIKKIIIFLIKLKKRLGKK